MMTIISIWMNFGGGGGGDDDFDLMIKSMLRHFDVSYYQPHDDGLKGSFFIVMITPRFII